MVKVDVFGIREEAPAGECSCGGACASTAEKTMGSRDKTMMGSMGR